MTGILPKKPIDLVPLSLEARPSAEANAFVKHIRDRHEEVRRKIVLSNQSYKAHADFHRKLAERQKWGRGHGYGANSTRKVS